MTDYEPLGKYRILNELGSGGFATVYRAVDTTLDREVALKVLDPLLMRDAVWVMRFYREAKAIARMKHAHIVTIYEIGEHDQRLYIAMEIAEQGSLADHLETHGAYSWDQALHVLRPICAALDYAHGERIIHRDLKPANILLAANTTALLSDFGFARLLTDNTFSISVSGLSMSGGIVGTPYYLAPELWDDDGEPSVQSDIYALSCIVYEMLMGAVLFRGSKPTVVMRRHVIDGPKLPESWPEGIPQGLTNVLAHGLSRYPRERYSSVHAMLQDLEDISHPIPQIIQEPLIDQEVSSEYSEKAPEEIVLVDEIPADIPADSSDNTSPIRSSVRKFSSLPRWGYIAGVLILIVLSILSVGLFNPWGSNASINIGLAPYSVVQERDGSILLTSTQDGRREIYRLMPDGELVRVTRSPESAESWGAVTTATGDFLFTSTREANRREIYRLERDGAIVRVTWSGTGASWGAMPELDGSILFTSTREDNRREVYRLYTNGEVVRVTHTPNNGESWGAVPEPGGSILFTSRRDATRDWEIYRLTTDGQIVQVTDAPGFRGSWSAYPEQNGSVLFVSDRNGHREIYRLLNNGEIVQVTSTPRPGESWHAALARDGSLLFTSDRILPSKQEGTQNVYRLGNDGTLTALTTGSANYALFDTLTTSHER